MTISWSSKTFAGAHFFKDPGPLNVAQYVSAIPAFLALIFGSDFGFAESALIVTFVGRHQDLNRL